MKLHTNNSNNSNSNINNSKPIILIDITSLPDKSVQFEKRLARVIFCIVHLIVYCVIVFRDGTILDQAFKEKDYFYIIWTHCIFISALVSYFLVSRKQPGFVSLSNSSSSNGSGNYNKEDFTISDESSSSLSQGCVPTINIRKVPSNDSFGNGGNDNGSDEININEEQTTPLILDNEIDKLKTNYFCKKCCVDIPLRTKHCLSCNRCVLKYDHHCVFIGGCVGLYNHGYFISFLVVESLLLILGIRIITTGFIYEDTIKQWFFTNLIIIPPTLLMFGGLCMPFTLFLFHSFLILSNQSSWEFNKYQRITYLKPFAKRGINPFNKGVVNNFKNFFREKPEDWVLPSKSMIDQIKKKEENSFNLWNNKYYSCCG